MRLDDNWIRTAETLPIIIWTARPDGRVEYVNRRWKETTGVICDRLSDDGWVDTLHPEDRDRAKAVYSAALTSGERLSIDCRIRMHDGSHRWIRNEAEPMRDAAGNIL
ncbi:MAG: PAS domain-containing protein, partial [Candidatus Eremiobacteraeota bacterium]|nr:PAS domain-containing protein [Candidatus Eremiobacteraeota bacterium]